MSVRASFVERFSESDAAAIMAAAIEHENGVHDNRGSDPFKWALLIAIGHECIGRYAEHHGITVAEEDVRHWAVESADLRSHDGDCDYLALLAGAYDSWLAEEESC